LLIPVNGRHRYADGLHDWLYANAHGEWSIDHITRELADDIYLEAMEVLGVPTWKRTLMYRAVRAGGWAYWKRRNGLVPGVDVIDLRIRTTDLINF
jgi:hypothetical protein